MRLTLLTLTTALLAISLTNATAQSYLTNGLVAYYPFNGNANDASGNGNNGTVNGATLTEDRFGITNTAYSFNGIDNYIGFAGVPTSQVDNWTMTAWVKPESLSQPESLNQVEVAVTMGYNDPINGDGYAFCINGPGEATEGELFGIFGGVAWINSGFTITSTNHWYQLVMLRSSGVTSFYVNGVSTPDSTTTSPSTPTSFRIGSENGLRFFNGAIDDVRIYNRALSLNEVAQLFAMETVSPKITAQPANVTVNLGDTAYFSVTAAGVDPLNYQWVKNGVSLPTATNATLTVTNVQPPLIGNYAVEVSDINGSVTSISASLSISNVDSALWQGLVAYYPFNGNANDASGNGNSATNIQATLCADRFGIANSAYSFNGVNNYIGFASVPTSQVDNWTMTAWVKPASLSQPASLNQVGVAVSLGYNDPINGNGYAFCINGPGEVTEGQLFGLFGGVAWVDGGFTFPSIYQWYQIVMLRNSGTTKFFVNGILTPNSTMTSPSTPTVFTIGSQTGIRFFNGMIDDVRIYNRALSSNDVASLYASEAPSHTAIGTATLSGDAVADVTIIDNGGGYTNTPLVRFIGGGGSGAQAITVVSNGVVVAINIIDAGSGFTNAPLVVIDPPFISNPVLGIAATSVLTFSNISVGTNYQLQQFQSPNWINQGGIFTASNLVYTQLVAGRPGSGDYRLTQTPVPVQAVAIPQVVNGFVVHATVINGGSGYVTTPAVAIVAKVGSNATAVASISGRKVTSITITSAGIGYVNPVTIQIDPPPITAFSPTVAPAFKLASSVLAPYDNYQIQFEPDISGAWENWNGGLFSPTNSAYSQYVFITNDIGYFRLQHVP